MAITRRRELGRKPKAPTKPPVRRSKPSGGATTRRKSPFAGVGELEERRKRTRKAFGHSN